MYHCRHCAPIREIRDQRLRLLYQRINPEAEIAHCRETVKFGTHCMPCEGGSYEEDTRTVMYHDGARPDYVESKSIWTSDYTPQRVLYSPNRRLECVCKPGFHCSSKSCLTCNSHTECKEGFLLIAGNHSHDALCAPTQLPEVQPSTRPPENKDCTLIIVAACVVPVSLLLYLFLV